MTFRGAQFVIGKDLTLYPAVRNGGFESEELDALLARVRPSDVIWDVGGNVGIYAVLLARAQPGVHVVTFEPVPGSRERLRANLARNGADTVTVEAWALSDCDGDARMAVHPDAPGCDQIADAGAPVPPGAGTLVVQTTTADGYASRSPWGDPDLIKVDIEGHEPEFLDGARSLIGRRRPTLMLEINPTAWASGREHRWTSTLEWLFSVYGDGVWFSPEGVRKVDHVALGELGPHAYMLLLPGTLPS